MAPGRFSLVFIGLVGCVSDAPVVDKDAAGPCTDPTFCDDKCGSGLADKCGVARTCASCGAGNTCDGNTHKCVCTELPNLCANRCGSITTNCNTPKDCGGCDGGACPAVGNCSNCTPDNAAACAGRECGGATNNCMQQTVCGPMNGACPGAKQCSPTGKCCETQSVTCFGHCGMYAAPCGSTFACGNCDSTTAACDSSNKCVCNCATLVPKAPNCVNTVSGPGCACAGSNGNTDPYNCGCMAVVCPGTWSCKAGACVPP